MAVIEMKAVPGSGRRGGGFDAARLAERQNGERLMRLMAAADAYYEILEKPGSFRAAQDELLDAAIGWGLRTT